ncbi:MAG: hydroxyacid dehydrogenase [Patescibacteria group bacterium]
MKIIYFYNEEWEKDYIQTRLTGNEFKFVAGRLQDHPEIHDDGAEALCVFVNSEVKAVPMDQFPKLKFIAARSTGYDHIDLAEAAKRGIRVSNVPFYGENTVAEFAFALLLTLSRKIYDAYKRIEQDGNFSTDGLRGFDLKGKTMGIIGAGRIGLHTARMARGFDMKVVAYDKFHNDQVAQEIGFKYLELDDLLAQSDVISLHAPYLPETHHIINLNNIGKIKPGAYLINTARGGLVDTAALLKGLQEGILAGAGLDVLEEEGYFVDEMKLLTDPHPQLETLKVVLANHYLITHPRVILTPHNAFNTQEALERILNTTIENLKGFEAGTPVNIVKS